MEIKKDKGGMKPAIHRKEFSDIKGCKKLNEYENPGANSINFCALRASMV
jgi:hypothetical protein